MVQWHGAAQCRRYKKASIQYLTGGYVSVKVEIYPIIIYSILK